MTTRPSPESSDALSAGVIPFLFVLLSAATQQRNRTEININRICLLAVMALSAVPLAASRTRRPANASPVQRTNRTGLGLSPGVATPDNILAVELAGDLRRMEGGGDRVEEASALEVGGLAGNFFRGKFGGGETHVMVGWYTYRYYKNNAQRIRVTVICPRADLEKSVQIIRSLKFR